MDDKDAQLRGKLEDLFSDLSESIQAEASAKRAAPSKSTPEHAPGADRQPTEQPLTALRTLAENATDAILLSNLAGRVTFSNRACCDLLGYSYTQNEMMGLETAALWPDEERVRLTGETQSVPQALAGEWHGEVMQRRKDGSLLRASLTLFPVPDEHEQPIAVASIIRDLTEHRQTEEALAQERGLLRTLIDNLPDLIYIKDRQSRFVVVNQAQVRLLGGTTPDDLLGKTDLDFFPHELAQKYYADEQAILQSGQPQISLEEPTIDTAGNKKWTSTTKVPLRDSNGQITGFVGVGRDITERKQAEAERERLLAEVERRALQLQTAAEVSRATSSILDPDELLPQVVGLIRDRFNLYYVGLFLVDETGQHAVLQAGTGEAGQKMLGVHHQLEISGSSMIAWCIANRQARIALDVGQEAVRFANPLLPLTRSEMALPLISRGRVIGAMTIQSAQPAAFAPEDNTALQSMADQMANAIENARLFEQTHVARQQAEVRLREMQMLQQVIQAASGTLDLERVLDALFDVLGQQMGFTFIALNLIDEAANQVRTVRAAGLAHGNNGLVRPLDQMQNDIVVDVARRGQIEVIDGWDDRFDREVYEREGHAVMVRAFVPLQLQEKPIGTLEAGYNRQERAIITSEEVRLLGSLASQVAVAVENTRLFEEMQRRATRERLTGEITARMRETLDVDRVLQIAVREFGEMLGAAEVKIRLTAGDLPSTAHD